MTEQLHPMVPPNILLNNWKSDWFAGREHFDVLLIQVYQAGADAELEACCEWLQDPDLNVDTYELRAARRPKPSSLKEQALQELDKVDMLWDTTEFGKETLNSLDTIRRAIESIPNPS
jgi:hypothetical protein